MFADYYFQRYQKYFFFKMKIVIREIKQIYLKYLFQIYLLPLQIPMVVQLRIKLESAHIGYRDNALRITDTLVLHTNSGLAQNHPCHKKTVDLILANFKYRWVFNNLVLQVIDNIQTYRLLADVPGVASQIKKIKFHI